MRERRGEARPVQYAMQLDFQRNAGEGTDGRGLRLRVLLDVGILFARLVRHSNQSVRQRRSVTGSNRSLRLWGKIVDKVGHFLVRSTVLVRTRAMYRPSLGVSRPRRGGGDVVGQV